MGRPKLGQPIKPIQFPQSGETAFIPNVQQPVVRSLGTGAARGAIAELNKFLELGRNGDAAGKAQQLLKSFPNDTSLHLVHARASRRAGNFADAISSAGQVLQSQPDFVPALVEMGNALKGAGQVDSAVTCYSRAMQLDDQNFSACHNLGSLFQVSGQLEHAVLFMKRAIEIDDKQGIAHFNLANTLRQLNAIKDANAHVEMALQLGYKTAEVYYLRAAILRSLGQLDHAIAALDTTLEVDPDHPKARIDKIHLMAHIADWAWVDEYNDHLKDDFSVWGSPFACLAMEDDPQAQLTRSRKYAEVMFPTLAPELPAAPRQKDDRINIGYFSADFHDHATLRLMGGIFNLHDRSRFRICVYSYDKAPQDSAREKVQKAACLYRDVAQHSDAEIAAQARKDQIDIAIDLKGYTENTRVGIFAHRAASIQVSWLGYPGSLGAPFMDYMLADAVTIPPGFERSYSEKVLRLPGCYQVNDDQRPVSIRVFKRAELGLPEDAFVFCCFNATYKICPQAFGIWMDILGAVDGSVLWLLATNSWAERNIRDAAKQRNIAPERIIFAPRWAPPDHLARHRAADLFLDTFAVNAHTTASDALWAGLPMLTRVGQQFSARVGASLLTAVGLSELVTQSDEEYTHLAIELAHDRVRLARIASTLRSQTNKGPLFDTPAFTKNLENAFLSMTRM